MTTARRRRLKVSYGALHLQQQTAPVSNVVANVAVAVVDVSVGQRQLLRHATRTPPEYVLSLRRLRQRRWRSVWDIYNELGATYFRRAYRMACQSFKHLAALLCPYILSACGKKSIPRSYRNGPISPDVQLACAIRWFAGGSAYNIMTTYGVSHSDRIDSNWCVVDAINKYPVL